MAEKKTLFDLEKLGVDPEKLGVVPGKHGVDPGKPGVDPEKTGPTHKSSPPRKGPFRSGLGQAIRGLCAAPKAARKAREACMLQKCVQETYLGREKVIRGLCAAPKAPHRD